MNMKCTIFFPVDLIVRVSRLTRSHSLCSRIEFKLGPSRVTSKTYININIKPLFIHDKN